MAQKKLVKYGVSNFEYGIVTDEDLVPTTYKVSGLTSVKADIKSELKTISADNGPYLVLSGGITETTQAIDLLDVNSEMKHNIFGIKVVQGVEIYPKKMQPNDVATLYRTELSNGQHAWIGMLKGKFSLPSLESKTTEGGAPDPNADAIEGTFLARGDADEGNVMLIGREDNPDFDFETFHKWVFPKTSAEAVIAESPQPQPQP